MVNKLFNNVLSVSYAYLKKIVFTIVEFFIRYDYKNTTHPTISFKVIRKYNRNRDLGPKKIICNAPFSQIYFKQDGKLTACCASSVDAYGHVNEDTIYNLWKGEKANQLRNRIKNYNLSGGCSGCQHSLETKNYNAYIGRIYDNFFPVAMKEYPTDMTFEISNTCNLECIMCSGEFSSLIRKNVEMLPEKKNYYDETFFENILEFLPHLERARFMGGEPFLIKQYAPIMEFLVNNNPKCKIYIQTNGTILNNAVKKIVESENVEISISIDSLQKESYEKIRKNGSYERTMENLKYFSKRAKENKQSININFCIMNNNWQEVPALIDFCSENNFTLNLIPVENPRHLALRICETAYLKEIVQFSSLSLLSIKNAGLKSVYVNYLSHLDSLVVDSIMNNKKRKELLLLTQEKRYNIAKKLFFAVNNIEEKSDEAAIFDKVFSKIEEINEEEEKIIFSNIIIDMENAVLTDKNINHSYDELFSNSSAMLDQMKAAFLKN